MKDEIRTKQRGDLKRYDRFNIQYDIDIRMSSIVCNVIYLILGPSPLRVVCGLLHPTAECIIVLKWFVVARIMHTNALDAFAHVK